MLSVGFYRKIQFVNEKSFTIFSLNVMHDIKLKANYVHWKEINFSKRKNERKQNKYIHSWLVFIDWIPIFDFGSIDNSFQPLLSSHLNSNKFDFFSFTFRTQFLDIFSKYDGSIEYSSIFVWHELAQKIRNFNQFIAWFAQGSDGSRKGN